MGISNMEGGSKYFRGDVPIVMTIVGNVNGEKFRVEGKGIGNAEEGYQRGKWVCKSGDARSMAINGTNLSIWIHSICQISGWDQELPCRNFSRGSYIRQNIDLRK